MLDTQSDRVFHRLVVWERLEAEELVKRLLIEGSVRLKRIRKASAAGSDWRDVGAELD